MRPVAVAAIVTSLVAGVGFIASRELPAPTPREHPGSAALPALADVAPSSRGEEPLVVPEALESERREPAPSTGAQTFYQWVDEKGSVRFARSLEEVPPQWRERAGVVSVSANDLIRSARAVRPARRSRAFASAHEPARRAYHDVTVYTAPWCGWCRKTMAFLDERGVDYVNKDIEADRDNRYELVEKSGGSSIPVVEIDGSLIRGYNPHEMTALLD